ncbi:MAG: tRNA epoxyqueuosine(34) reductase QueG [Gemmatimonadaceae bacterium]|nr:tRNA epoxyqueuosine(34) reductase QueG [Gemmatimonadaceae bacterium]
MGGSPTLNPAASPAERTRALTAHAFGLGFDAVGVAALGVPETWDAYAAWLEAGRHASMQYLEGDGARLRHDSRLPHPGATHAIVVAASYGGREPSGPVARYARGDDYHEVLRERLRELHRWLETSLGRAVNARPYVDSSPILERDLAQRAGLGWFGKNTMLITPSAGSFLFVASLFVELELEASAPFEADRCGTCTRCLDACPTGALPAPRQLDASRCISYLTIEHREAIPVELRESFGGLLYGCDICNDVCPWNKRFARDAMLPAFAPRDLFADTSSNEGTRALAREILMMTAADYAEAFRGSAMKRAKLWMLQRNACVVLGNVGTADDLAVLEAMGEHEHPIVAEHAAWARHSITRDR